MNPLEQPARPSLTLDRLGGMLSAARAVHCLITPVILIALPTLGTWWSHPAVHWALALFVVPLAGFVLARGYRRHRVHWVAIAAAVGAALILLGLVLPLGAEGHHECCAAIEHGEDGALALSLPPATLVTIAGSVALVAAHIGNLKFCRCCGA